MYRLTLTVQGSPYPVEVIKVTPLPEGRLSVQLSLSARLNRGESCILRNALGREVHCVVSNVLPSGQHFDVELRCIADENFATSQPDPE